MPRWEYHRAPLDSLEACGADRWEAVGLFQPDPLRRPAEWAVLLKRPAPEPAAPAPARKAGKP